MYLNTKLEGYNGTISIAFIGCGKFISMFLSQYNQLKKIATFIAREVGIKSSLNQVP